MAFDVPILFIVFNRPDTTAVVFERIREMKPKTLFVAADGPRENRPGEKEKCESVRKLIMDGIDWDCNVQTKFSDVNQGCGLGESSAMLWFFNAVGEGIVIEDDTLPDHSFFNYCRELLHHYRDVEDVFLISGDNFQDGKKRGDGSYYFSGYSHSWGYASWWRAWKDYDFNLEKIDDNTFESLVNQRFDNNDEKKYWMEVYKNFRHGKYDTWDFQFLFIMWLKGGRTIIPNVNLVTNIGFGSGATHTTDKDSQLSGIPISSMEKIIHPTDTTINKKADTFTYKKFYEPKEQSIVALISSKIKKALSGIK